MVKPGKLLPPDPRPWTADPESRKARKEMEKEVGGFDWGQAIALGFIGATVVFGIDKSIRRYEERHEEEDRREDRRRQQQRESRSRPRRSSQSVAGSARGSARTGSVRASSVRDRGYDRDYDDGDDREYWDRYYEEREAMRAARDYDREPARTPESMRAPPLKDERDYAREAEQFDRGSAYGRRYDDRRSRSIPASRSRGGSNW